MSLDTVKRIDDYVADAASGLDGYTIVSNAKNEDLRPQGSGLWMEVFVDTGDDQNISFGANNCATEEGVVTFQINDRIGIGNRNLYSIEQAYDDLRAAFMSVKLQPATGEDGVIYFNDMSTSSTVEINDPKDRRGWMRKRVFISYRKDFGV